MSIFHTQSRPLYPQQRRVWRILLQYCAVQDAKVGLKLYAFSLAKIS